MRFFEVIDGAWGVQQVAYRTTTVQLKLSFMLALAKLFSSHTNFWEGERLVVSADQIRKLSNFPLNDPTVITLASSSGMAPDHLCRLMEDHYNSGRRAKKLQPRPNHGSSRKRVGA